MRTKIGMAGRTTNTPFDPRDFLANVGEGKTILEFGKGDVIFSQGDEANTIFYIQKGRVKVVVISEQAKKLLSVFWSQANSLARAA
jgi:CRP/FNR family transcriptional regulator, cyclic AMP receptor protein